MSRDGIARQLRAQIPSSTDPARLERLAQEYDMALKPIASDYLSRRLELKPGDRLHRLVARLFDTYIDDLTDEAIVAIEQQIDTLRITHADGSSLRAKG